MVWQDIQDRQGVGEINRIVDVYEVWLDDDFPVAPIKIKVTEDVQGYFTGIVNYSIQSPTQADPYRSLHPQESVEDAINDALSGLLHYWPKEDNDRKNTRFELDKDF